MLACITHLFLRGFCLPAVRWQQQYEWRLLEDCSSAAAKTSHYTLAGLTGYTATAVKGLELKDKFKKCENCA